MDSKGAAAAVPTQVYEDFEPTTELVQEQDSETLQLNLTGFKKEQLRVQLTGTGILKISGQRPVDGQNKSLRFQKDFPVSENCDKTRISAKFKNGILYVEQPKLITSSDKKDQELPTANAQQPKKPADEPQPQKKDEEQAKGEKTTPPTIKEFVLKSAGASQVYEDFVPTTELVQEQDLDTLLLHLTGFKKEQVRVQLTRTGILKISGQRPVVGQNKSLRFQKDFPVSENCDKTKISAKFENGSLYVKQPKLITSLDKKDQELPTANAQQPKKPADEPQPQKKDEEQAIGEKTTPLTTKDFVLKSAGASQVYEDFVPTTELVQEPDPDTLLLHLTGFKKEQVRVQLTRTGILKINGQMPVVGQNKWLRFQKDFPVSENCDKTKISAKFENGILYVKQPKLITSLDKKDQELPTANAQQPKKPADEPQPQKKDEEQAKGEKTTPPTTKDFVLKSAGASQVYEDFVPSTELVQEPDPDTLLLHLTGFKKEQVRVQLTRTGILKISGQRPVVGENKSLRFQKEVPVSENCDKTKISAKFENGILYVKQPKRITSSEKKDQELPTASAQKPKKPVDKPQPQKKDEERAKGEKTPTPTPTPTEEVTKLQTNADKREKEEPNTKEAKDIPKQSPAEHREDVL